MRPVSRDVRQLQDREMEKNDKKFWFPAMKYGVGWGFPVTWQGWAVLLAYIALLFLGGLFIQMFPFLIIAFVIYVFILSGLLLYICWKKGEKPEIRWGKKV
jgi:hypothetical protein